MRRKLAELEERLREMVRVLVAYSGGVDSTFLLRVAHDTLGREAAAVVASSAAYAAEETEHALRTARRLGVEVIPLLTRETEEAGYRANGADRCYHCKAHLYGAFVRLARERGYPWVVDGTIADDAGDHRPGRRAAKQLNVRSPLLEVGFSKEEVRALSREMGLPTWDKPAEACLSSRIAYGLEVTPERLERIHRAERVVLAHGFRQVRVRDHGRFARLEVEPEGLPRLRDPALRGALRRALEEAGFPRVVIDAQGYRSGSMNALIKQRVPRGGA